MSDPAEGAGLEQLVERHAKVVRSAIRKVLGDRHADLGSDVEQELRLALLKRGRSGKTIEHPVSYLYKAAMTTAWAVLERESPREEEMLLETPANPVENLEASRLVGEMLLSLPEERARALKAYLAGFNHDEVAELYGWTPSVARHRIYRAMDELRRRFAAGGGPR
jgi:RNA polymerase sigma factor (sigma-70 family)